MQMTVFAQQTCANPFQFHMNIENPKLLREWLPLYLEEISKYITINTYNNYSSYMYRHILPQLGEYTLTELTTPIIKKYIEDKLDHGRIRVSGSAKGLSAKTVKEHYTFLKKALDKAVEAGEMYYNPCHSVSFPKALKQEIHALEQEEQIKLEAHIRPEFEANSRLTAKLALYAGLRNGEICALQIKDVDFESNMILVSKTLYRARTNTGKTEIMVNHTKNKRHRYVPIPKSLLEDLKRYVATMPEEMRNNPDQYLFVNRRGKPLEPKRLLCHFKELLKEAGLQDIRFHNLRHTFATRCLECGIELKIVSKILGHSTIQITADLYTHVTNRAMKNAMSRLVSENWNYAYQRS